MSLWAKVRRLPLLAGALVTVALLLWFGRGQYVTVPTVLGGGVSAMAWSTVVPLLWSAALCAAFDSTKYPVEGRPVRNLALRDALLFSAAPAALAAIVITTERNETALLVLAHAVTLAGIGVCVTLASGAAAGVLASTAVVVATSSYSPHVSGGRYVRFLQPEGDPVFSILLSTLTFAVTLVVLFSELRARPASTLSQRL